MSEVIEMSEVTSGFEALADIDEQSFEALSDIEKVGVLVAWDDNVRLDIVGGYRSKYVIENDKVYIASAVDGEPILTVATVTDYIAQARQWFVPTT